MTTLKFRRHDKGRSYACKGRFKISISANIVGFILWILTASVYVKEAIIMSNSSSINSLLGPSSLERVNVPAVGPEGKREPRSCRLVKRRLLAARELNTGGNALVYLRIRMTCSVIEYHVFSPIRFQQTTGFRGLPETLDESLCSPI